jgi:hypothetical protein
MDFKYVSFLFEVLPENLSTAINFLTLNDNCNMSLAAATPPSVWTVGGVD